MLSIKLFACLFALTILVLSTGANQSPSISHIGIKQFLSSQLGVDIDAADNYSVKNIDNKNKIEVHIQKGRKKYKVILQRETKPAEQFKLVFMQEIRRFGNEKSFIDIKTSKGTKDNDLQGEMEDLRTDHRSKIQKMGFLEHEILENVLLGEELAKTAKINRRKIQDKLQ